MVAIAAKKRQEVEYVALEIPNGAFSDDQLYEFCQLNDGLKIERLSTSQIIISSLEGGNSGLRNAELTTEFGIWNRQKNKGESLILLQDLNYQMESSIRLMLLGFL